MTYVEDPAGLAQLQAHVRRQIEHLGDAVADDMRRGAPVDTGQLKNSIERGPIENAHGFTGRIRIWARTPYAVFVELGTRPHIIRAKNAKVLANRKTGQVFGPVVHHPGTKPNPFMRSALYKRRTL